MGTPDIPLGQASSRLNNHIAHYGLQPIFSAAFGYPIRREDTPARTNADTARDLLDFLPDLSRTLQQRGITALPIGPAAALNCYRTTDNLLLLDGRLDLLIAPSCLNSTRQVLLDFSFSEVPGERANTDSRLFVHGEITCCLHTQSARFYNPATRQRYLSLETAYRQGDALCRLNFGSSQWYSFPPLFLIIYMTAQIQRQLFDGRPSLRTYCDWLMILHGERTALGIAESSLTLRLSELHLLTLYRALGSVGQQQFRLERNSYAGLSNLTEHELQLGQWLWSAFVEQRIPKCRPGLAYRDGLTFLRKIKCWSQLSRRSAQLHSLCSSESGFAPWVWITRPELR
jgi:hypothetical protein